jgi:hypothetical protein
VLRHVALFRFTDGTTDDQRRAAVESLRTLPGLVPSIRAYHVGLDAGHDDGNWDLAVVGDYDDADAWRAYISHPEHVRVADTYVRPFVAARAALQYEI